MSLDFEHFSILNFFKYELFQSENFHQKISLRTRLSTPGEPREGFPLREGFFKLGETRKGFSLARDLSREDVPNTVRNSAKDQAKGSARLFSLAGVFLPHEGNSVSATERTWALRPPQSHGRAYAW